MGSGNIFPPFIFFHPYLSPSFSCLLALPLAFPTHLILLFHPTRPVRSLLSRSCRRNCRGAFPFSLVASVLSLLFSFPRCGCNSSTSSKPILSLPIQHTLCAHKYNPAAILRGVITHYTPFDVLFAAGSLSFSFSLLLPPLSLFLFLSLSPLFFSLCFFLPL